MGLEKIPEGSHGGEGGERRQVSRGFPGRDELERVSGALQGGGQRVFIQFYNVMKGFLSTSFKKLTN